LEKLGWIPPTLAAPEYNKLMLKGKVDEVKSILAEFSFPYSRRIAGEHTHFTMKDYKKWLKEASINHLSLALRRLAQLNQTKVYLFWRNPAFQDSACILTLLEHQRFYTIADNVFSWHKLVSPSSR